MCVFGERGVAPAALESLSLPPPPILSLYPIIWPQASRLQTTPCTNHSKFITQYPVPYPSTTRSPHLPSPFGPKGIPKMEKTKVNPDPCSSSGRRGLGPRNPSHRSQQAGEWIPPCPESKALGSHNREHAGRRSRSRGSSLWEEEEEQEGWTLPEESGSLGIPGMHAGASGQQGPAPGG